MKICEVMQSMAEAVSKYGDINVEICEYSSEGKDKNYWLTSAFHKDGRFILGFNKNPFGNTELKKRGKKHV